MHKYQSIERDVGEPGSALYVSTSINILTIPFLKLVQATGSYNLKLFFRFFSPKAVSVGMSLTL